MADRHHSPTSDAPEALPDQSRSTFGFVGSDDYEYYEPPPTTFDRQRSPVPEYQRYEHTSPQVSEQSHPPTNSDIGRSPQISDGGFTKQRPLSPSVQYSEIHSPHPEIAYDEADKEAVYTPPQHHSKVPSYYANPVPGHLHHQNSNDNPEVGSYTRQEQEKPRKRPFYKRWLFWLIIVALIIIVAVAVALGVVFGTKKSKPDDNSNQGGSSGSNNTSPTNSTDSPDNPNVDIQTSVGGYINNKYYSESGAWNGSGIAIAAANTNYDLSIYAFYQDAEGMLQFTLSNPQGQWNLVGPVNAGAKKALNGTPLSTVQHQVGNEIRWHLFYVDEDYYIRERIITNTTTNGPTPIWTDGPLSSQNLKTWESNSIGLQACYWGNYYGQWSYEATQASAGIHIWFASDSTVFQQYSWTNGTDTWNHDQQWNDLSGNAGVGCQTWDSGQTEYVWFVDTSDKIAMYWKDNNRSATAYTDHPIGDWTPVDIGITGVQKDSSLGYTNYMIYQAQDTTIRGAAVVWGAENTTIATGDSGLDTWTLQYNGQDVHAIRGTHISITAVKTVSNGASLLAFFQQDGDEMKMYTRDAYNSGGLWQQAAQDPVTPSH